MGKRKKDEVPPVTGVPAAKPAGVSEQPKKQKLRAVPGDADEKLEERFVVLCEEFPDGVGEDVLQARMGDVEIEKRAAIINSLLQRNRLQLYHFHNMLMYKLVGNEDAKKFRGLGPEEMLVYQLVEKEATNGIWIKHLRTRSNLPQQTILKILKVLLTRQLIKAVKQAESKQKVFMLYDLEPSEDMVGRAWGAGTDFDESFVNTLKKACLKHIGNKISASAEECLAFLRTSNAFKTSLTVKDVVMIAESLSFDGLIEKDPKSVAPLAHLAPDRQKALQKFRLVKKTPLVSPFLYAPCSVCPVYDKCSDNGVINPVSCHYFNSWLDF